MKLIALERYLPYLVQLVLQLVLLLLLGGLKSMGLAKPL